MNSETLNLKVGNIAADLKTRACAISRNIILQIL